jgi:hypothetical protein
MARNRRRAGADATAIKSAQLGRFERLAGYDSRSPTRAGEDLLSVSEDSAASPDGEDGVIADIMNRVGMVSNRFVEFGVENGVEGSFVCLAD